MQKKLIAGLLFCVASQVSAMDPIIQDSLMRARMERLAMRMSTQSPTMPNPSSIVRIIQPTIIPLAPVANGNQLPRVFPNPAFN